MAAALGGVALLVVTGCGRQEITRTKLEHDVGATYENLLAIKRELLARPRDAGCRCGLLRA